MEQPPEQPPQEKSIHSAVMLKEVVEYLNPRPGQIFVDGTLGLGGHAKAILERLGPQGRLITIDRDSQSIAIAKENLSSYLNQCEFIHDDFRNLDKILSSLKIVAVDAILLDLGISSFQLDNPQRGFSIRKDGPLDMRMDQKSHISAFDLINSLSEKEIDLILKDYGQERWHSRIARSLVSARAKNPIETTQELTQTVLKSIPHYPRGEKIHPATRTFQAFRIAVNRELESLELALPKCIDCLKAGGRICVIAFHSLEDRIVKQQFRLAERNGSVRLITKKPLRPSEEETRSNPRARSAKLRVAEKI